MSIDTCETSSSELLMENFDFAGTPARPIGKYISRLVLGRREFVFLFVDGELEKVEAVYEYASGKRVDARLDAPEINPHAMKEFMQCWISYVITGE